MLTTHSVGCLEVGDGHPADGTQDRIERTCVIPNDVKAGSAEGVAAGRGDGLPE